MNKALFKQYDSRWGSKPYPTKGSSFSGNGCGCVACTHLIIEQEKYKNLTPEPVRQWMVKQGFAYPNQGTTWSGITKTLEHYGYKVVHIASNDPMSKAWTELNKGNRIGIILFLGGKGPNGTIWTAGGHYVAFTDYYVKNGKHYFYTKDSGGRDHDSAKYGYYTYENSMKGLVYQMWIVEKISSTQEPVKPTPQPTVSASTGKLTVDGVFGKTSVKAMQKLFETDQDGLITGQLASLKQYHKGFSGNIKYGSNGSNLIKALQIYLNLNSPDGQLGPNTIKALQKLLKITVDGVWGPATSKAMQTWINNNPTLPKNTIDPPVQSSKRIKGMDISAWQGKINKENFEKAKNSGIKFVILRLGYTGSSTQKPTIDSVFENNYTNAIAAGLPVGVYYYSLATNADLAKKEADFCIKNLKGKTITYPVYIDVEDPSYQSKCSKATLAKVCNYFCAQINTAGYKSGVYASLSWFNNKIGEITAPHSKWVAQYNTTCDYKGAYDMWQYSSSGKVKGLSGKIDVNYWYNK